MDKNIETYLRECVSPYGGEDDAYAVLHCVNPYGVPQPGLASAVVVMPFSEARRLVGILRMRDEISQRADDWERRVAENVALKTSLTARLLENAGPLETRLDAIAGPAIGGFRVMAITRNALSLFESLVKPYAVDSFQECRCVYGAEGVRISVEIIINDLAMDQRFGVEIGAADLRAALAKTPVSDV